MKQLFVSRVVQLIVAWSCLLRAQPSLALEAKTDSLLRALDQTLARQATFDQQRLGRLAALKAEYYSAESDNTARYQLGLLIHQEYRTFKYDSAFAYALKLETLATRLRSPAKQQLARMRMAFTLRSAGLFKEAFDTLQAIEARQLAPRNQAEYYELCALSYAELADYDDDGFYRKLHVARSLAYADTAARYFQPGSEAQLAQRLFEAKQRGDLRTGIAVFAQLRQLALAPHQLAIYASSLAKLYEEAGRRELALPLMVQAAIGDLESATKEGIALFRISEYCYQLGDLQRAYYYSKEARKAATFFKARQRLAQMSRFASRIDGQKINIVEHQRLQARHYAVAIGVLATLLLGFAFIIYSQLRRLKKAGELLAASNQELHATNRQQQALNDKQQELNQQLQALNQGLNEANHIKEEYIGYYFSNTSRYLDKLEVLQKKLSTLLTTKQVAAAQQLVKGIDIKAERAELFKGFDTVFIHLFPNFVREFNSFFTEADRIQLTEDNLLTTELRIFALIRLGVTDSEQISRILGYSIHTVYAYKTRVKNRSFLPNETFEARVLAIQAA